MQALAFWKAADRSNLLDQDLADIARLLEAYPHLRRSVPSDVLDRLL
jgi:hypothetical protein